jgi:hypothetical protein
MFYVKWWWYMKRGREDKERVERGGEIKYYWGSCLVVFDVVELVEVHRRFSVSCRLNHPP